MSLCITQISDDTGPSIGSTRWLFGGGVFLHRRISSSVNAKRRAANIVVWSPMAFPRAANVCLQNLAVPNGLPRKAPPKPLQQANTRAANTELEKNIVVCMLYEIQLYVANTRAANTKLEKNTVVCMYKIQLYVVSS